MSEEAAKFGIDNGWLVEYADACTCSPHFGAHERHCGMEAIGKVEDLLADTARAASAAAENAELKSRIEALADEIEKDRDWGSEWVIRARIAARLRAVLAPAHDGERE